MNLPLFRGTFNSLILGFIGVIMIKVFKRFSGLEKRGIHRILFISRGGLLSGSQRQLVHLIKLLDRNIYEPVVVCNKGGDFVKALDDLNVEHLVLPLHPWRKFLTIIPRYMDLWRIRQFAQNKNISLVHCGDLWMSGYMLRTARYLKVPSILHVRRPVSQRDVRKFHCDCATRLIAISTRIADNLISAGISPEKVLRIDDGVDVEFFTPEKNHKNVLREQFSLNGQMLIGIIGRIDEFKRQLDFLAASREALKQCGRPVLFFVIGEVHSRSYLEKIKKFISDAGIDNHVIFTDRREDMPDVISSLDILVSLSGGSIMFEAMAAGKAVISAGFTPKKYSYHIQDGKTGVLVESKEPADLAHAITKLVDMPELRIQIGKQARQWALKELTHTKMAIKTQQLYADLLPAETPADNQNNK